MNYTTYHLHSDYSLLDSCTSFKEYIDAAVENGQRAIAFTEHGKPMGWVSKKLYCDQVGIQFIHGVEIYLTESLRNQDGEKVRDNYHTILLAKNWDGVLELNDLVSRSCQEDHFYYVNRISFDEFLSLSDNILSTSACLASPLNKLPPDHPRYLELAEKYDYLEIQPHAHPDQVAFNRRLLALSQQLGKPIIAGTDTHSLSPYKAECRSILMKAKHKSYGDEDAFDLTYKTYDQLAEAFRRQNALPEAVFLEAMENTNRMAASCEPFQLDTSIKYPVLYGSREADAEKFTETVQRKFQDKLSAGIIPPEQESAFRSAIQEEMRVFRKLQMDGFMLSMSELISWCKAQGMAIGTARGSVGGSRVAYVTDIIDLNPETWHTVFSRFCNEDRVEIGDIDIDCVESDRPAIFQHIIRRFGADKTARVASFGTIKSKGVIDDVGRALDLQWKQDHPNEDSPYSLKNIDRIKKEFDADEEATKQKYPDLFYYYDGLLGAKVSQSVHPAGMVISPIHLPSNYGVFNKDGELCLMLDMDEAHEVGAAKYDFLVLKTVQVIRDTCRYLGRPYPKTHEIDWDDPAVWADMVKSPIGIFQMESAFAFDSLKKFQPKSIFDMSLVTAAIRPSGASYRDDLLAHKPNHNPSNLIDDLLKDNMGYLCIEGNQLVDTIKGQVPIKDVKIGDMVLTRDGYKRVVDARKTGRKSLVRVEYIGTSLLATPDHKVLTDVGWKACCELKPGDVLAWTSGIGCKSDSVQNEFAKIVGWLVGDGSIYGRSVQLTNRNINVHLGFRATIETLYPDCTTTIANIKSRVTKSDLYKSTVRYKVLNKRKKQIVKDLESCGLMYKKGKEKFIPDCIKNGSDMCLLSFIGAYTDTDSCLRNSGKVIVAYKTASSKLAYDLQFVVRKLGFIASITEYHGYYAINVSEARAFLRKIHPYSIKASSLYDENDLLDTRISSGNLIRRSVAKDILKQYGMKRIQKLSGISLYQKQKYISVDSVRKAAASVQAPLPDYLTNNAIKWVKVSNVTEYGEADVYDLTVEDKHEFVCQGIIVHNCYQEDIIKFLQEICGLSGSTADSVRRGIARKNLDVLEEYLPTILDGYCSHSDKPREVAEEEAKSFIQVIEDASAYMFGMNHSIAYCLLGYLCAYFRYYHPVEFITAFLNDAANDEDIRNGTALAKQRGITIVPPKFGISRSDYFFTKEKRVIAKGLSSVKYMGKAVVDELYALSKRQYATFTDLLWTLSHHSSLDARQLDILIKIDFFSDFGNQRELFQVVSLFDLFKKGEAKQLKKERAAALGIEDIVAKYSNGTTKSGKASKSYTLLFPMTILRECEQRILSLGMEDLGVLLKSRNFKDIMGYAGYISGKEEDRNKLYIKEVYPVRRKRDNAVFGYSLVTQSIGSGKESRMTVFKKAYDADPVKPDDILVCKSWARDGKYFQMLRYEHLYA